MVKERRVIHTHPLSKSVSTSLSPLSLLCLRSNVRDIGHPRDRTVQADGADLDVDLLLP